MRWFFLLLIFFPVKAQKKWALQECIEYAIKNNLNIKKYLNDELLAKNQLDTTKRWWWPKISTSLENNLDLGVYDNKSEKRHQRHSTLLKIDTSTDLYNGGLSILQKEKAEIDFKASKQNTAVLINEISLLITNSFLNILLNKELKNIALENLETSRELLEQTQDRYKAGAITQAELSKAQSDVAFSKKNVVEAQIKVDRSLFDLALTLQLDNYELFDIQEYMAPAELEKPLEDFNKVLQRAYTLQPSMKYRALIIASRKKSTQISKASLMPRISFKYKINTNQSGRINTQVYDIPMFSQLRNNMIHTLNISLTMDIWNPMQKLNVQKSMIEEDIARNAFLLEKQKLLRDVQSAFFEKKNSYASYEASLKNVKYAEIAQDDAKKSYEAGKISIYDYNRSIGYLTIAQSRMLQSRYHYIFKSKIVDFYAGIPIRLD